MIVNNKNSEGPVVSEDVNKYGQSNLASITSKASKSDGSSLLKQSKSAKKNKSLKSRADNNSGGTFTLTYWIEENFATGPVGLATWAIDNKLFARAMVKNLFAFFFHRDMKPENVLFTNTGIELMAAAKPLIETEWNGMEWNDNDK